MSDFGLARTLY